MLISIPKEALYALTKDLNMGPHVSSRQLRGASCACKALGFISV